jgi:predicted phosphoribosyltransferase
MNPREDVFGVYDVRAAFPRIFRDRRDAGARLGWALAHYRGEDPIVLGVPRGGVPVAAEVARALDAELDVAVARKIGAPGQEELAMGAICADGARFTNEELVALIGISEAELDRRAGLEHAEARRREQRFRQGMPPLDPAGRVVIVVDDGLATGATLRATIRSLRARNVRKLVVAVPVGARDSCALIASEADELVCPHRPEPFLAVGLHYESFGQTSDEEVVQIIEEHRRRRAARA